MKSRPLFKNPILWLASTGVATLIVVACSSSSTPSGGTTPTCTNNDSVACVCPNGQESTAKCNDPASCACGQTPGDDSGPVTAPDSGHDGDGGHVDDGASPSAMYSACAKQGSFGYPCTIPNANDPANCTDPNFPYCFGGGQGYWCTAFCGTSDGGDDAGDDGGDAGVTGLAACLVEEPDGGYLDAATSPNQGCGPTACNAKGYCK